MFLVSAQCAMTCVVAPCHLTSQDNLPPCHRHHSPKSGTASECTHPLLLAEMNHPSCMQAAPVLLCGPITSRVSSTVEPAGVHGALSPPPDVGISITILRV